MVNLIDPAFEGEFVSVGPGDLDLQQQVDAANQAFQDARVAFDALREEDFASREEFLAAIARQRQVVLDTRSERKRLGRFNKRIGGPGASNLLTIQDLNTFNTGELLQDFASEQRAPGGFLAPGQQQAEFGVQARSIVDTLGQQQRQLEGDLRGLNPTFANRANSSLEFGALQELLGARQSASTRSAERNFQTDQGIVNALAAQDVAEKQGALQALQFRDELKASSVSAKRGASSAKTGAVIGGAAVIGAALI